MASVCRVAIIARSLGTRSQSPFPPPTTSLSPTRPSATVLPVSLRPLFLLSSRVYTRRFLLMSTKNEKEEVVYLEDLVAPTKAATDTASKTSSQTSTASTDTKVAAAGGAENGKPAAAGSLKRQRTLVDMFSAAPASTGSKKLKLEKSGSAGSLAVSARMSTAAVSGSQSLNSIAFSLSAYQESLSEIERQMLGLECETLGKSW